MKIFNKLLVLMISLALYSCSSINYRNTNEYNSISKEDITLIYSNEDNINYIDSLLEIKKNMQEYFINYIETDVYTDPISLYILPMNNKVINFKDQGSSATCTPHKHRIYLLDFYNLDTEVIKKYGNPPKDILYSAFTHEMCHCSISKKIKVNNDMNEVFSIFCSYINFQNNKFEFYNNEDLSYDMNKYFSTEIMKEIKLEGFKNINLKNIKNTRIVSVLLAYLHSKKSYKMIKEILFNDNINNLDLLLRWSEKDYDNFIMWLNLKTT